MNSVIEDTYFFYRHCFQSNIADKEKKKLVELTIKHAHLSRFAALLPFKRVDNIGVERIVESKFNAIKMAIIATNLKQQAFIQSLFDEGIEMYRDMGPFRSVVDFIGTEIRVASINTWAFEVVAPVNFMLKWHIGMPRPEEVAWMIYNDEITTLEDGVPEDLVSLIKSMNMQEATDFTAYYDGSPMHPSFPAMHSAGSTCSFWLPVLSKITPEQFCEALRVDYAVSYARTVAGVHYPQDNLAGLNIGQRIMRETLPSMLEERYGYDSSMVASKLEALSFDWNTFDSETCTIGGVSSADFLRKAGR